MNKFIYTVFIAFISSLLTLLIVNYFSKDSGLKSVENIIERHISLEELAQHNNADSCWKAINGKVYDITKYIPMHPTSMHIIEYWCGKESSEAWARIKSGRGHSEAAANLLEGYFIGYLDLEK